MENVVNNKKTYVVGHKNPDTDSICSAIAYAELKTILTGREHSPRRAGQINEETQYVLNKFGAKIPVLLSDLRVQIKDVELRKVDGISGNVSIKEAWEKMKEMNIKTLPVTRGKKLEGLITIGDIATSYMDVYDSSILSTARTQYRNIVSVINGTVICGNEHSYLTKGKVCVVASTRDMAADFVEKDDLVILGNRIDTQQFAVDINVGCMVVSQNNKPSKEILKQAKEKEIVIISSPYDTYTVARLINQSIPVKHFMTREGFVSFKMRDYVDDAKLVMAQKKYRDFPIVDGKNNFLGFISRRRLINSSKKQVILVDHNEKNQAVDGIEEASVIEIIDHHRLSSIETIGPVFFRNQPVGCTATIVYQMYQETLTKLSKSTAGLLCAAIISDTLMFRSPTCTTLDEYSARQLSQIAGIDIEKLAKEMFNAGSNLKGKSAEEILQLDFKQFTVNETDIGVGQINSMNEDELREIKETVLPAMEKVCLKQGLDMVFFMLTNIISESSELICCGKGARAIIIGAYDLNEDTEELHLKGVVSRKKQLVPTLVSVLQQ